MTAMAYTILKLHAAKLLKCKDMDKITDYLQVRQALLYDLIAHHRLFLSTSSAKTSDIPMIIP